MPVILNFSHHFLMFLLFFLKVDCHEGLPVTEDGTTIEATLIGKKRANGTKEFSGGGPAEKSDIIVLGE